MKVCYPLHLSTDVTTVCKYVVSPTPTVYEGVFLSPPDTLCEGMYLLHLSLPCLKVLYFVHFSPACVIVLYHIHLYKYNDNSDGNIRVRGSMLL